MFDLTPDIKTIMMMDVLLAAVNSVVVAIVWRSYRRLPGVQEMAAGLNLSGAGGNSRARGHRPGGLRLDLAIRSDEFAGTRPAGARACRLSGAAALAKR
jgi:hypothetical protein